MPSDQVGITPTLPPNLKTWIEHTIPISETNRRYVELLVVVFTLSFSL